MEDRTTQDFLRICHKIGNLGNEIGSSGNFSLRVGDDIFITPSGISFNSLTKYNICIVKLANEKSVNESKPSSDLKQHILLYKNNSNITAIYHTHSHYSTLASMVLKDIPVLNTMHADYFGKPISCLPYVNHRAGSFVKDHAMEKDDAILLGKHGGLLAFSEFSEAIIDKINAFNEICHLYCENLMINVDFKLSPINRRDVETTYDYYSYKYGDKK